MENAPWRANRVIREIVVVLVEISFVQRPLWRYINLYVNMYICAYCALKIHDVLPFTANRSSAS